MVVNQRNRGGQKRRLHGEVRGTEEGAQDREKWKD